MANEIIFKLLIKNWTDENLQNNKKTKTIDDIIYSHNRIKLETIDLGSD